MMERPNGGKMEIAEDVRISENEGEEAKKKALQAPFSAITHGRVDIWSSKCLNM